MVRRQMVVWVFLLQLACNVFADGPQPQNNASIAANAQSDAINASSVTAVFPVATRNADLKFQTVSDNQVVETHLPPSMFTLYTRPRLDFIIFFSPSPEDCQVITVAAVGMDESGEMKDATDLENSGKKIVFRPMENLMEANGKTFPFIGPKIAFYPVKDGFMTPVWKELDGFTYVEPDKTKTKDWLRLKVDSAEKIAILTSSPNCYAVMSVAGQDNRMFSYLAELQKSRDNNAFYATNGQRKFKDVMLNTELSQFKVKDDDECCSSAWLTSDIETPWDSNLELITYQRFTTGYRLDSCKSLDEQTAFHGISAIGTNLDRCEGFRICFGTKAQDKTFCSPDKPSIEIMPRFQMYIPTDSDDARTIQGDVRQVGQFRFRFFPKLKMMQMQYMFSGHRLASVQDWMVLDWSPYASGAHIDFAFYTCRVRLAQEHVSSDPALTANNCLNIELCECLEAKKVVTKPNQFVDEKDEGAGGKTGGGKAGGGKAGGGKAGGGKTPKP